MKKENNSKKKLSLNKLKIVRIKNGKSIKGGGNGNGDNDTVVDKTFKDTIITGTN